MTESFNETDHTCLPSSSGSEVSVKASLQKTCIYCGFACYIRCKKCVNPACGKDFTFQSECPVSPSKLYRKNPGKTWKLLRNKAQILHHSANMDIFILTHKSNPFRDSSGQFATDGLASEFAEKYPIVQKLWTEFMHSKKNTARCSENIAPSISLPSTSVDNLSSSYFYPTLAPTACTTSMGVTTVSIAASTLTTSVVTGSISTSVLSPFSSLSSSSAPHTLLISQPIGLDSIPLPSTYSSATIMPMPTLLTSAATHVISTPLCSSPTTTHVVSTSVPTFSASSSTISSGMSYPLASTSMGATTVSIAASTLTTSVVTGSISTSVLSPFSSLSSSSAPHTLLISQPSGLDSIPSPSTYSSATIMPMPTLLTSAATHVISTPLCSSPTTTHVVSTSVPTFSASSSTISSGMSYPLASTTMSDSKFAHSEFQKRMRRKRCKQCAACLAPKCMQCKSCKFPQRKKPCMNRVCIELK